MKQYLKLKHFNIYGAPVFLHWSVLLAMSMLLGLSINSPILALISICSYFGIIMLHEIGHAFVANRLGYGVRGIYLGFFHGKCIMDAPYRQKHRSLIAWGGVTAQFIVAIPLIISAQALKVNEVFGLGPVVAFLGYISALVALVNLAPGRGLDGFEAWRLIPVLVKEYRKKRTSEKKNPFKVIK